MVKARAAVWRPLRTLRAGALCPRGCAITGRCIDVHIPRSSLPCRQGAKPAPDLIRWRGHLARRGQTQCFGKGINRIHVRESQVHAIIAGLTLRLDA